MNAAPAFDALDRPPHLLLVDDDDRIRELLKKYLAQAGARVSAAADAAGARKLLDGMDFDLLILDVMMPVEDGFSLAESVRKTSKVPIVFMTARGLAEDRIRGLSIGADDYVPKPCTPRELAARLRAILKRTLPGDAGPGVLAAGDIMLWPGRRIAEQAGRRIDLTATEFNLLTVLARHAGQAVSKETLSQEALQRPLARYDRSIDVHVSSIRQKLLPCADGRSPIQTVIRQGYVLVR